METTIGFTPLDGILTDTRSGGIDPGILLVLWRDAPPGATAAEAADSNVGQTDTARTSSQSSLND